MTARDENDSLTRYARLDYGQSVLLLCTLLKLEQSPSNNEQKRGASLTEREIKTKQTHAYSKADSIASA